jgi:hypothetical protein
MLAKAFGVRDNRRFGIGLALSLLALACRLEAGPDETMLDDFEKGTDGWSPEVNSSIAPSSDKAAPGAGKWSMRWTLHADGTNRYGNNIVFKPTLKDWSGYSAVIVELHSVRPVTGRIGCQVFAAGKEITLPDLNPNAKQGEWTTIEIPLPADPVKEIAWVRFFCDALAYEKGDHVFYLDNFRLKRAAPEKKSDAKPRGTPRPAFSSLSPQKQEAIRKSVAPPPLAQRRNPYSTPMYYPMWGESSPDGTLREDWQEVLIKEWAELGMTKLHFYKYPDGVGTASRSYKLSDARGIEMFVRLCQKYGVKIGLRVDLPYVLEKSGDHPAPDYWISHPKNPNNELQPWLGWLEELVTVLKGNLQYVVVGDELDWKVSDGEKQWNSALYMQVFIQAAEVIHKADPAVKVSMYGASSGRWNEIVTLLQDGYTKHGDAVAINHYDYETVRKFKADLVKYSPNKKLLLLSNGVGYVSSETTPRNPPKDPYSRYNDADQAAVIARTMYTWWDVDADVAPYYICLRGYTYKGEYHPWWYGFFGFMDLNIGEDDKATVKRYPGWYAYRTVANVFHDRDAFTTPVFAVEGKAEYLKAHERKDREMLLIAWGKGSTDVRIASPRYAHPVRVNLLNHNEWSDVEASQDKDGITLHDVPLGLGPTIVRLVALDAS